MPLPRARIFIAASARDFGTAAAATAAAADEQLCVRKRFDTFPTLTLLLWSFRLITDKHTVPGPACAAADAAAAAVDAAGACVGAPFTLSSQWRR